MKKILLLILSLALVAGLFVFFLNRKDAKSLENQGLSKKVEDVNGEEKDKEEESFLVPSGGWDIKSLAEAVSNTLKITEEDGLSFSFSQPDIPKELHLSVKFQIFDEKGATIERFVSDAGYMTDPKNYVSEERYVEKQMETKSLKGNMAIASVTVKNEEGLAFVYQHTIHYDGSKTIEHALKGDK